MGGPPAGWMEDPEDPSHERWWDGDGWGEQRRPKGTMPPWAAGAPTASVTGDLNPLAVASLVASLVWMGGLSSVAAIVLGVLAKQQIGASGGRQRGEGMATAGIVLGIVGIVLPLLALVGGFLFLLPFRAL
jgi:hypothetical protein